MIAIESDARIRPETEQAPELFAPEVVLTLAKQAGYEGGVAPKIAIFDEENGFPETTAFIRATRKPGYYRVTKTTCSCPDWKYRAGPAGKLCKHQSKMMALIDQHEFDAAYAEYKEKSKEYVQEPLPDLEADEKGLRAKYEDEHIGNPYIDYELSFQVWRRKYLRLEEVNETLKKMGMDDPGYWDLEDECSELCGALGY